MENQELAQEHGLFTVVGRDLRRNVRFQWALSRLTNKEASVVNERVLKIVKYLIRSDLTAGTVGRLSA